MAVLKSKLAPSAANRSTSGSNTPPGRHTTCARGATWRIIRDGGTALTFAAPTGRARGYAPTRVEAEIMGIVLSKQRITTLHRNVGSIAALYKLSITDTFIAT